MLTCEVGNQEIVDLLMEIRKSEDPLAIHYALAAARAVVEVLDADFAITDQEGLLAQLAAMPEVGQARVKAIGDVVWSFAS